MQHTELPIHDVDNDDSLSQRRKDACKIPYQEMTPADLDKIFMSTFVYDKKTGEPIAKKPKSIHELIWCMLQSQMVISQKVLELELQVQELTGHIHELNPGLGMRKAILT